MVTWEIILSRRATKEVKNIQRAGLGRKVQALLAVIKQNPFQNPPPYEKLSGNLAGYYSRRINRQHRLVYEVDTELRTVHVLRMWTHYE